MIYNIAVISKNDTVKMLSLLDLWSLLDYCAQIHMYRNMKVVELH